MQRVAIGLLLAGSILGVVAEANADCPEGSRAVATAIKAVVPAAPPGLTTLARC
jgi:hypothetical protein